MYGITADLVYKLYNSLEDCSDLEDETVSDNSSEDPPTKQLLLLLYIIIIIEPICQYLLSISLCLIHCHKVLLVVVNSFFHS